MPGSFGDPPSARGLVLDQAPRQRGAPRDRRDADRLPRAPRPTLRRKLGLVRGRGRRPVRVVRRGCAPLAHLPRRRRGGLEPRPGDPRVPDRCVHDELPPEPDRGRRDPCVGCVGTRHPHPVCNDRRARPRDRAGVPDDRRLDRCDRERRRRAGSASRSARCGQRCLCARLPSRRSSLPRSCVSAAATRADGPGRPRSARSPRGVSQLDGHLEDARHRSGVPGPRVPGRMAHRTLDLARRPLRRPRRRSRTCPDPVDRARLDRRLRGS